MADLYLRSTVVPPDGVNDVRLYADGADVPPPGGSMAPQRMLMGIGMSLLFALLVG